MRSVKYPEGFREKNVPVNRKFLFTLRKQWFLQVSILFGLGLLIVFSYIPMYGIIIAFKSYKVSSGIAGFFTSRWVGLKWFKEFLTDYRFGLIFRNTLVISALKIFISFPVPIIFALMLNEMRQPLVKRFVQTASYLPHFISWVIVVGLCQTFFGTVNGLLSNLMVEWGLVDKPIPLLTDPRYYWPLAVLTEVWKSAGWNAIIYIAAISGIDAALYEAAQIDGTSRLQRMWYITLPGIKGVIVIMFILSLGGLINGNLEQAKLLSNNFNRSTSEIINLYVLNVGLGDFRFDYAAAVGLMQSVISAVLVFSSNWFSRRFVGASIY
ncbi:MAG: ABC transporter permease subunit [Treponema sp.]|nr:ABC transporter permease subunit [Treponema sp.]